MSADRGFMPFARAVPLLVAAAALSACSWFTDFKDQPDLDPWQSPADTIGMRGNPQFSVPTTGSAAPGYAVSYARGGPVLDTLGAIPNPVPADQRSLENGRKYYQINCAVCHGNGGGALPTAAGGGALGNGPIVKYGLYPPSLRTAQSRNYSDGYLWGIIRNGRGAMMPYNRIEELDRWDVVNYMRALQQDPVTVDTLPPGTPGETGRKVPGYSRTAPSLPAPYVHLNGATVNSDTSRMPDAPGGRTTTGVSTAPAAGPDTIPSRPEVQP